MQNSKHFLREDPCTLDSLEEKDKKGEEWRDNEEGRDWTGGKGQGKRVWGMRKE